MNPTSIRRILHVLYVLSLFTLSVEAAGTNQLMVGVCTIIVLVDRTLMLAGPSIVGIMFLLGGIKYTFSSDDPGGRKQGKTMLIHALIGGILIACAIGILRLVVSASALTTCYTETGSSRPIA